MKSCWMYENRFNQICAIEYSVAGKKKKKHFFKMITCQGDADGNNFD